MISWLFDRLSSCAIEDARYHLLFIPLFGEEVIYSGVGLTGNTVEAYTLTFGYSYSD